MHVKLVNSPSCSLKNSYSEALKKHFAISRMLNVGDVFAIPSSGVLYVSVAGHDSCILV